MFSSHRHLCWWQLLFTATSLALLVVCPPVPALKTTTRPSRRFHFAAQSNKSLQEPLEVCHYVTHKGRSIPFRAGATGHLAHTHTSHSLRQPHTHTQTVLFSARKQTHCDLRGAEKGGEGCRDTTNAVTPVSEQKCNRMLPMHWLMSHRWASLSRALLKCRVITRPMGNILNKRSLAWKIILCYFGTSRTPVQPILRKIFH